MAQHLVGAYRDTVRQVEAPGIGMVNHRDADTALLVLHKKFLRQSRVLPPEDNVDPVFVPDITVVVDGFG